MNFSCFSKEIEQNKLEIEQNRQEIEQSKLMIEQKNKMLQKMVRMLTQMGISSEDIARKLSLSLQDVKNFI